MPLPNFSNIPASVGSQAIPDFLNFGVIGPAKTYPVPEKFNLTTRESPLGTQLGSKFDQGKLWHPIRAVEYGFDDAGLKSFCAQYNDRVTRVVGTVPSTKSTFQLHGKSTSPVSAAVSAHSLRKLCRCDI
jgi:hypothetical protein